MTEALLALVVDLSIAGVIFLIWYFYKDSKAPKTEGKTKTAEAPTTPAPEKEFPWGLIIGGIILIIAIIAIASVVSNLDSQPAPKKTTKTEEIVTVRVYANGYTCAVTPFFEKGQTIVITATGNILDSTNQNRIGPEGYQSDPINIQGYKKCMSNIRYRALIGYFEGDSGHCFHIGTSMSIEAERSGIQTICFTTNKVNELRNNYENDSGYYTVTIRVVD